MIKTQQVKYWESKWELVDGLVVETGAQRATRTERFIHIPMPWTRAMYTPVNDDYGIRRPVFAVYWYDASPHCLSRHIRFGWTSWAVKGQLMECEGGSVRSPKP